MQLQVTHPIQNQQVSSPSSLTVDGTASSGTKTEPESIDSVTIHLDNQTPLSAPPIKDPRSPAYTFTAPVPVSGLGPSHVTVTAVDSIGASISKTIPITLIAVAPPPAPPSVMPLDQSTRAALVRAVLPHAVVEVYAGTGQLTLLGSSTATGNYVRVPLSRRLVPGEKVAARQKQNAVWSAMSPPVVVEHNYVTHHYDIARTGWNPFETTLNRANAAQLQLLFVRCLDDAIRAQPLYVQNIDVPGKGRHNIVLVGTESDSVYAYDADSTAAWEPPLWQRNLIGPGEFPVQASDVKGCDSQLGVTATPVIDRTTNTMYVSCILKKQKVLFHLHAIDLSTGEDRPHSPVEISDSSVSYIDKNGHLVPFNPITQGNRPGLLLNGGVVYLAFGSHCYDSDPYHGWVVAFEADVPDSPTFLQQIGIFNTTPDITSSGDSAGIWQSGMGLAGDEAGNVYCLTGNGLFDAPATGNGRNYGNTVLKLGPAARGIPMTVVDYFTPYDWLSKYGQNNVILDNDLGSGGPVLVPDHLGQKKLLLAAGKVGKAYVIDRDNMGKNVPNPVAPSDPNYSNLMFDPVPYPDKVVQFVRLPGTSTAPGGVAGGPAYYEGPNGAIVFYGCNWRTIKGYRFVNGRLQEPPAMETLDAVPSTSPIPAVSSNGSAVGTGVMWAVIHPAQPVGGMYQLRLHAYAAEDLSDRRFAAAAGDWQPRPEHFGGNSFQVPTVINGRVYTGSRQCLLVWGLPTPGHGPSEQTEQGDEGKESEP